MRQISPPRPVNPVIGFKSLWIPGDGADTAVVPRSSSSSMMVDQQIGRHKANYTPIAWLCNIDSVKFNTSLSGKRIAHFLILLDTIQQFKIYFYYPNI